MKVKGVLLILALFAICVNLYAEERPKVIVGITISQFYPEWIKGYEYELGSGGFNRIVKNSKYLRGDYGYAYSQTGTDQATIYTGTYPSEHGIVSHTWFNRLNKRFVKNIDSDTTPVNIQSLSASAYLRMSNPYSKAYSIAMRAEDAIMAGGAYATNIFWFDDNVGRMTSSTFCMERPTWLSGLNRRINADSLISAGWMPLLRELQFKRKAISRVSAKAGADFYYDLQQLKNEYSNYSVLNAVPFSNDIVTECAIELMKRERIGMDKETDLLMLNFSSLDYMNRDYAVNSMEFKDLVMRMDRCIERILNTLDEQCGPGEYTLFVTFAEGRELLPVDLAQYRYQGNYFSIYRAVALLKSYLKLLYGDGDWIASYNSSQIYLNRELIQRNKLNLADFQRVVADFIIDFEGISTVITATELNLATSEGGDIGLIKNSYSSKRSGDVFFTLEQYWIPTLQDREDSYCRYSKRRYAPVFFYGKGSDKIEKNACQMIDVLPTICHLAGIILPYNINGVSLME